MPQRQVVAFTGTSGRIVGCGESGFETALGNLLQPGVVNDKGRYRQLAPRIASSTLLVCPRYSRWPAGQIPSEHVSGLSAGKATLSGMRAPRLRDIVQLIKRGTRHSRGVRSPGPHATGAESGMRGIAANMGSRAAAALARNCASCCCSKCKTATVRKSVVRSVSAGIIDFDIGGAESGRDVVPQ